MDKERDEQPKRVYSAPSLIAYGNVEDLTNAKPYPGLDDASFNSRSGNKGCKTGCGGLY